MDFIKKANNVHNILTLDDIVKLENTYLDIKYPCYEDYLYSKGFTLLHHLIILASKYPTLTIIIKEYLELYPEEINKVNTNGWSALMLATANYTKNNIEIIKCLVENKADINIKNYYGKTALMFASMPSEQSYIRTNPSKNHKTVKYLLKNKADVNTRNDYGCTALMCATRYNSNIINFTNRKTVKYLLESNIDVNIKDKEGFTALSFVTKEVEKVLLEYDAITTKYSAINILNTKN